MLSPEEFNRARWAARRGMLELDLVLEPFVAGCFERLEPAAREQLLRLLQCEDQQLYAWLLGREAPTDGELHAIVDRIRDFIRTAPADR